MFLFIHIKIYQLTSCTRWTWWQYMRLILSMLFKMNKSKHLCCDFSIFSAFIFFKMYQVKHGWLYSKCEQMEKCAFTELLLVVCNTFQTEWTVPSTGKTGKYFKYQKNKMRMNMHPIFKSLQICVNTAIMFSYSPAVCCVVMEKKKKTNVMKETEKKNKNSWVPLYFVLYYTLNRSGEIYGKIDSFEIRSPLYIAHHRYDVKWSFIHFPKPGPQSHSLFTYRERSETPLKQHSCRHKWNEAQFTKYAPLIITTIQRLLKYDPGINDTFQKSAVGTH